MAFQETTTTGYGTRVGRSFKGIGSGILLFLAGTALLWWNEGRAVKTDKMLNEAESAYVEMENPNKIDPALDGELIHASALATTEDSLVDQQFGIGAVAINLQRDVEYYQWVEHSSSESEDKLGGKEVTTTTYTYTKEWVSSPVQSSEFKDPAYQNKNMVLTTVEEQDLWAENVTFGAYKLPSSLFHSISSEEKIDLNLSDDLLKQLDKNNRMAYERTYGKVDLTSKKEELKQIAAQEKEALKNDTLRNDSTVAQPEVIAEDKTNYDFIHQNGNVLYYGLVPGSPQVGDVRVTFTKIVPAKVTVMAQVKGDTFKAFKAKNSKTFQTLRMGTVDADEIFESEHAANNMWLWVFRILGIILVVSGLKGIFGFLEMILKVVPFVANIIGWGVGVVCTVIGVVWSLIIIALAWLFYRPLIGITLLAIAGFLIWVFAFKGKDKLKELAANRGKGGEVPAPQPQRPEGGEGTV